MRFHLVRDRTITFGVLAVAACGLVMTACASENPPGAASSATSSADTTTSPPGTTTSPAATATSPSSPSAAGVDACVTSRLKISLTNTGALAGQAGGYLKFTNDSGTPCRMSGWPAVTALKATGQAARLRHMQS